MAGHQRVAKDLQKMSVFIEGKPQLVKLTILPMRPKPLIPTCVLSATSSKLAQKPAHLCLGHALKSGGVISLGTKVLPKHADTVDRVLTCCNGFLVGIPRQEQSCRYNSECGCDGLEVVEGRTKRNFVCLL